MRQVIPGNKREEEEEEAEGRNGVMVVKGLAASAEAFEALKPRSVTGTQTRALYSCLCTETLGGLKDAAAV